MILNTSAVIDEDIANLAKAFKDYIPHFSGKTFLITGACGFLGKYMVLLLKHLNEFSWLANTNFNSVFWNIENLIQRVKDILGDNIKVRLEEFRLYTAPDWTATIIVE